MTKNSANKSETREYSFEDCAPLFTCGFANRGLARLDFDEAACLFRHARGKTNVLEIGRFHGGSTLLIAMAMTQTGQVSYIPPKLLSLDAAPRRDEELWQQIEQLGLTKKLVIETITARSDEYEYSPEKRGKFDLIFVDGGHDYQTAKDDHLRWGRRLEPGGVIIHHDMAKTRANATQIPELARLREDILREQSSCVEMIEEAGSISVFRRRGGCWRHF